MAGVGLKVFLISQKVVDEFIATQIRKKISADLGLDAFSDLENRPGYVYFIQAGPTIKIGLTKNNPMKRLKELQTGNARELLPRHYVRTDDMFRLERELHEYYAEYRREGEWFALPEGELEKIRSNYGHNHFYADIFMEREWF